MLLINSSCAAVSVLTEINSEKSLMAFWRSSPMKTLDAYAGSIYYYEPFYQLMRQTLWAENMVRNKENERLKVDNYLHVHVIPSENDELLWKEYKVSRKGMEDSWRDMLIDQSTYVIIDPKTLMSPTAPKYPKLHEYLGSRYWLQ